MPPKGKTVPRSTTSAKGSAGGGRRPGRKAPPPVTVGRPKPWGLIAMTMVVVLFAAGVIGYAVYRVNESKKNTPEAKAAAARLIQGIALKDYPQGLHKQTPIAYDQSPPFGGEHDPTWADCTGTVYAQPIRNENAVHMLEHGAVWITYRPGLAADQVDTLKKKVDGVEQMAMSPYPGLKTAVSLQSWGHQLFVDSASDARIDEFIKDLRLNPTTTPEYGASCVNPAFKAAPRTPEPTPTGQ
jgi:hypothetical protein